MEVRTEDVAIRMRQVPLERDINIAINGPFWVEVANPEHPFTAMLISYSRGTCLIVLHRGNSVRADRFCQLRFLIFRLVVSLSPGWGNFWNLQEFTTNTLRTNRIPTVYCYCIVLFPDPRPQCQVCDG